LCPPGYLVYIIYAILTQPFRHWLINFITLITIKLVQAAEQSAGYTAPEVDMTGQYTLKSDVYSFGVVMLELLTGRRPFDR
jgi:hypothetical protein